MAPMSSAFVIATILLIMTKRIDAQVQSLEAKKLPHVDSFYRMLVVNITVLNNAVAKGAVCLDGNPPAYHLHKGFGSGANSWLVNMEGGGWCHNITSCLRRARSRLGSSLYMGESIGFSAILSDVQSRNPDFYNWNRVMVRYCDGSSFTGDVDEVDQVTKLHFRGYRIWQAVMEDLLAKGMNTAEQALLTGCSSGGLTTFIHCDEFRNLLPRNATVKCMPDAGFFLDSKDVSGGNQIRKYFNEIVTLHGSSKHLPTACTSIMDPANLCFFPQYLLPFIKTPIFVINAAYDSWQIRNILAPVAADPNNDWQKCKMNIQNCSSWQLKIMQSFRTNFISALSPVTISSTGGLFINSCYSHCQTNIQILWHSPNTSPKINSRTIAEAAGDWFFERRVVKYVDCPYPCDSTCQNRGFAS